jgi:predicted MFS family arabinose efflux permease
MSAGFLLFAFYVPFMRAALEVEIPSLRDWAFVVGLAFVVGNVTQAATWLLQRSDSES